MNTTTADSKPGLVVERSIGVQSSVRPLCAYPHRKIKFNHISLLARTVKTNVLKNICDLY